MAIPTPISPDLGRHCPGLHNNSGTAGDIRPWRVLHLCGEVANIAPVLEVQFAAGMRPIAFTPSGPAEPVTWFTETQTAGSASLLSAWREVRKWRRWLAESDGKFEIIHAHRFSAGMAAARAGAPLVYDIRNFVEQPAGPADRKQSSSPSAATPGPWLARSFRTAEQFVLQRAAAVIVHSNAAYRGALERGTSSANLFVLPELACPLDAELEPAWQRSLAVRYDAVYGYVFSRRKSGRGPLLPPRWQPLTACI